MLLTHYKDHQIHWTACPWVNHPTCNWEACRADPDGEAVIFEKTLAKLLEEIDVLVEEENIS